MHNAMFRVEAGAATHAGKVRRQNEDSYLVATRCGVWAVADGMGGHQAGDVASRLVVEELNAIDVPATAAELMSTCRSRIERANRRLQELSRERNGAVIGTTLAMLLIFDLSYACLWSGDSRIYRIRRRQIEQISTDHTEVQELISEGKLTAVEARTWPRRNVITRAIGVDDRVDLAMESGGLEPGDTFVICSDGLTGHVEDPEILALASQNSPQRACDLLVALTLERGAADNVTVVAVRFEPDARPTGTKEDILEPG